jgi:transposase
VIPPRESAEFVSHMEDVLDVYCRPYDLRYPVVCLDESSKELHAAVHAPLPMAPGKPERIDDHYQRQGTINLFLACEPLRGWRRIKSTERRTKVDWAHFVRELVDVHYPNAARIVLVMDNLNTHRPASLYEAFEPAEAKRIWDRLELHYTPKHGSWLNIAECEFSVLSRQCTDRRFPDEQALNAAVVAWQAERNADTATVNWRFTTQDARIRLKHLYPTLHD